MTEVCRSIRLHNTTGGSDKIYEVTMIDKGDGKFVVNYANGRRGSTMATGTKTAAPVDRLSADKIFEKVKKEKLSGGYVAIGGTDLSPEAGIAIINTAPRQMSGFVPQQPNTVGIKELEDAILSGRFVIQQKFDGERRPVIFRNGEVTGVNKKGETVALDQAIADDLKALHAVLFDDQAKGFEFDAEQIGDKLHIFDATNMGGDIRHLRLTSRLDKLDTVCRMAPYVPNLIFADTAFHPEAKLAMVKELLESGHEGVVIKNAHAPYEPGRPASGGNSLKFKFYATLSAIVEKVNDKRSVEMALLDERGDKVSVGNVTVPANQKIPEAGSVIEVRYLYAYRGGSLFQPTLIGPRADVAPEECGMHQVEFKGEMRASNQLAEMFERIERKLGKTASADMGM